MKEKTFEKCLAYEMYIYQPFLIFGSGKMRKWFEFYINKLVIDIDGRRKSQDAGQSARG
jgi:hypothetical protein